MNGIRDAQTYAIIGAAMEVHRELGHGFPEAVYHDALCNELRRKKVPYGRKKPIAVHCKGDRLDAHCKADPVCFGDIILELKALTNPVGGIEKSQLLNYLKAAGFKRGLLFNFGRTTLEYERLVF